MEDSQADEQDWSPCFHGSTNESPVLPQNWKRPQGNNSLSHNNKRVKTLSALEQVLLTEGAVLQLIIDFVPCFELSNKASVCQLWKKAASQSYRARINTPWTTLSAPSKDIISLRNPKKEYYGGRDPPLLIQALHSGRPLEELLEDDEDIEPKLRDEPSILYAVHGYKQQLDKHLARRGFIFYKHLHALSDHLSGEKIWRLRLDFTFISDYKREGPIVPRYVADLSRGNTDDRLGAFFAEIWQAPILQRLKLERDLPAALLNEHDTKCIYHSLNLPTGLMIVVMQRQWTEEYSAYLESEGLEDSFKSWRPEDEPGVDYWGVLYHVSNPFLYEHATAELVDCKRMASNDLPLVQVDDFICRSENGKVLSMQTAVASEWRASHTNRNSFDGMIYTFKLDREFGIQCNHAVPLPWPGSRLYSSQCLSPSGDWFLLLNGYAARFLQYNKNTKSWDVVWDHCMYETWNSFSHFSVLERKVMQGFFTADGDFCVQRNGYSLELGGLVAPGKTYALSQMGRPYMLTLPSDRKQETYLYL